MTTLTPTCPDLGVWRAWLDHEDNSPDLSAHLESCTACSNLVEELRGNASIASDAIGTVGATRLPSPTEIAIARDRLAWRQRQREAVEVPVSSGVPPRPLTFPERISTPWRVAASGLAAAIVLSLGVAFTPEGRAAAAGFLAQFRSQQVTAINISPQSQAEIMGTLKALGNLGTVKSPTASVRANGLPRLENSTTVTLDDARKQFRFPILTPNPSLLPAGMDPTPRLQITQANEIRFTFDKNMARKFYDSTGHPDVNLPDKFDGATLVVSMPSAVLLQYGNKDTREALIVGEAGELEISVDGKVSLDEMRDFLLSLPGLPKEVTDQLKVIRNWKETLPLPIPTDRVNWKAETFNGVPGLLLNDNTGVGSAAIWQSNGQLFGVAGSLKKDDLKKVAESLH